MKQRIQNRTPASDQLTFASLDEAIRTRGQTSYAHQKTTNGWQTISWQMLRCNYLAVASFLQTLVSDHSNPVVGIACSTRYEWNICDFAILAIGGITVGFYNNDRDEIFQHILSNAKPSILIVENENTLNRIQKICSTWGHSSPVILIDGTAELANKTNKNIFYLKTILEQTFTREAIHAVENSISSLTEKTIASYIYTSGTSGLPKAAVLTHGNLFYTANVYTRYYPISQEDSALTFLPFSHVFARVMYYSSIQWGMQHYYVRSVEELISSFAQVNPSLGLVVPRLLEKVHNKIIYHSNQSNSLSKIIFKYSVAIGHRYYVQGKKDLFTQVSLKVAKMLVLDKIRNLFGKNLRFLGSGGGHLSKSIVEFFLQFGIPIYQGYATTESGGLGVFNHPSCYRLEGVGLPVKEVNVKLAQDQEILIKSAAVFQGYLHDTKATEETLKNGWLHTGDTGQYDETGNLFIIGRKKDLLITAYGKNIAPTWIEEKLLSSHKIEDAVIYGHNKPYLVALIVPAEELLQEDDNDIFPKKIYHCISKEIDRINQSLSQHEKIKRFDLIKAFDIESGTMTATFKKRRTIIHQKYKNCFDQLYQESVPLHNTINMVTTH